MSDDTPILTEIMLQTEIFCSQLEGQLTRATRKKNEELLLKIAQCRGALSFLQGVYEDGQLTFEHPAVAQTFRHLVISLMWVSFYGGPRVDFEFFRKLVQIESGFTSLLLNQIARGSGKAQGGK